MYKVTIEKIENITALEKGAWVKVADVPYSKDDMETTFDQQSYSGKTKTVYGYLDDKEVTREKSTKVLEQTVEDLDLVSVIKAINNIKEND